MQDAVIDLSDNPNLLQLHQDTQISQPISWLAGGTGFNIAEAAASEGYSPVKLIAKVGKSKIFDELDTIGALLVESLERVGVEPILASSPQVSTGTNVIVYTQSGTRMVFSDNIAETSFVTNDVTSEMLEAVENSSMTFVSGFSLLTEAQASATCKLINAASAAGSLVVLDVVPHQIYKHVSTEAFRRYTDSVHVLISEINTIRRLFPESTQMSTFDIGEFAELLLEIYPVVLLRPSNDVQYLFDRSGLIEMTQTNFSSLQGAKKRGFSDRLSVHVLYKHFQRILSGSIRV